MTRFDISVENQFRAVGVLHHAWLFEVRPKVISILPARQTVIASLVVAPERLVLHLCLLQITSNDSSPSPRPSKKRWLLQPGPHRPTRLPALETSRRREPHRKVVFNAPFSEKNRYHVTIANLGEHRILWIARNTNMKRLAVEPPAGVLDPKEQKMLIVTQETFSYETEDTNNDRITVDWQRAPGGATKKTLVELFPDCIYGLPIRRKCIPIQYNP